MLSWNLLPTVLAHHAQTPSRPRISYSYCRAPGSMAAVVRSTAAAVGRCPFLARLAGDTSRGAPLVYVHANTRGTPPRATALAVSAMPTTSRLRRHIFACFCDMINFSTWKPLCPPLRHKEGVRGRVSRSSIVSGSSNTMASSPQKREKTGTNGTRNAFQQKGDHVPHINQIVVTQRPSGALKPLEVHLGGMSYGRSTIARDIATLQRQQEQGNSGWRGGVPIGGVGRPQPAQPSSRPRPRASAAGAPPSGGRRVVPAAAAAAAPLPQTARPSSDGSQFAVRMQAPMHAPLQHATSLAAERAAPAWVEHHRQQQQQLPGHSVFTMRASSDRGMVVGGDRGTPPVALAGVASDGTLGDGACVRGGPGAPLVCAHSARRHRSLSPLQHAAACARANCVSALFWQVWGPATEGAA